jgi:hypothetical protein
MLRLMRRSIGVLACAMLLAVSYAQPPHQVRNADFPSFKLLSGATDSDGFPTSGAKLCLLKATGICFQMPSYNGYSGGSVTYEFGLDPVGEKVPVTGDGSVILFSAQFSGGGSGTLDRLAILRYGADGRIVNLLPYVGVTNQSDRAIWQIATVSNFPILVTADFDWAEGETHFSEHRYVVKAYKFDPEKDRYLEALSYETSKKYPGLDEVDRVDVLNAERAQILKRIETPSQTKR